MMRKPRGARNARQLSESTEMATAKPTTEPKKAEEYPITEIDLTTDAGAGMENVDQESFAIPFLTILQKGSPQVDEDDTAHYVQGARQGMIYETVSGNVFDGKEGVYLIPCAYRRVFLRWGPRDAGGGFKGEFAPEVVAQMRADGKIIELENKLYAPLDDGSVHEKRSDRFADVRNHYCLLLDRSTGAAAQVLLSLTSTQIKKSKALMSMLNQVRIDKPGAGRVMPATYMNVVHMTTVPEANDKGTWYGAKFELVGMISSVPGAAALVSAARAFNASVAKGSVAARYEEPVGSAADERGGF